MYDLLLKPRPFLNKNKVLKVLVNFVKTVVTVVLNSGGEFSNERNQMFLLVIVLGQTISITSILLELKLAFMIK